MNGAQCSDFTEDNYRKLVRMAKNDWEIIDAAHYRDKGRICFVRHDVDLSLHRAYRLAVIEAEEGVRSTYFINLHSRFYNPLEDECAKLILGIIKLGHLLGLHFDPTFYYSLPKKYHKTIPHLEREKEVLSNIFQVEIRVFSIHNPGSMEDLCADQDEICEMINTYGPFFRTKFVYCSDSNGCWRHKRLQEVLEAKKNARLHILIHPGWWTKRPMTPHEKAMRCIDGRAKRTLELYHANLKKSGR